MVDRSNCIELDGGYRVVCHHGAGNGPWQGSCDSCAVDGTHCAIIRHLERVVCVHGRMEAACNACGIDGRYCLVLDPAEAVVCHHHGFTGYCGSCYVDDRYCRKVTRNLKIGVVYDLERAERIGAAIDVPLGHTDFRGPGSCELVVASDLPRARALTTSAGRQMTLELPILAGYPEISGDTLTVGRTHRWSQTFADPGAFQRSFARSVPVSCAEGTWRISAVCSSQQFKVPFKFTVGTAEYPATFLATDYVGMRIEKTRIDCALQVGGGGWVDVGVDEQLVLGHKFTQEVWILPALTDDAYHGLLGNQPGGEVSRRSPSIWVCYRRRLHVAYGDGVDQQHLLTGPVLSDEPGRWHHVAVVFDGSCYSVHVDGVLVHTQATVRPPVPSQVQWIGRVDNTFSGAIAEVRLWNVARTQAEIQADMHRRLDGTELGLLGYWSFDRGLENLARRGVHGVLQGDAHLEVASPSPFAAEPELVELPEDDGATPPSVQLAEVERLLMSRFPDGAITFSDELLAELGVPAFLTAALGEREFVIEGASYGMIGDMLRVVGTSRWEVVAAEVVGEFHCFPDAPEGQQIGFRAALPLSAGWKLSLGFPALDDGRLETPLPVRPDDVLDGLGLTGTRLVLASHPSTDGEPVAVGLNLIADVSLHGLLAPLAKLSHTDSLTIAGNFSLADAASRVVLSAVAGLDASLGPLTFDRLLLSIESDLGAGEADSRLCVIGELRVGARALSLTAALSDSEQDVLRLRGDFSADPPALPILTELATAVGLDLVALLPAPLHGAGGLVIRAVDVSLRPSTAEVLALHLAIGSTDPWNVHPGLLVVSGVTFDFTAEDPFAAGATTHLEIRGVTTIAGADLAVTATLPGTKLTATLDTGQSLDLAGLFGHFGLELADIDLLDAQITALDIDYDRDAGTHAFRCTLASEWPLTIGGTTLALTSVSFAHEKTDTSSTLTAAGTMMLGGVTIAIDAARGDAWKFTGTLERADIDIGAVVDEILPAGFDLPPEFMAIASSRVELVIDSSTFDLAIDTTSVVDLGGTAELSLTRFGLGYALRDDDSADWRVELAAGLRAGGVLDIAGSFTATLEEGPLTMSFTPQDGALTLELPLPLPGDDPRVSLALRGIELDRDGDGQWHLAVAAEVGVVGLSGFIDAIVPDAIDATLKIDGDRMTLAVEHVVDRASIDLPAISLPGGGKLALGALVVDVSAFALTVAAAPSLSADLHLGLPEGLNGLFGFEDGQPRLRLFRTYDPADPHASSLRLRLLADEHGLSLRPLNSPVVPMTTVERDGRLWWDLDMGSFGAAAIAVPEFTHEKGGSLVARGGFDIVRPLCLPMTPIKALFDACGLGPVADLFPDGLELRDVHAIDGDGRLAVDALDDHVGGLPGPLKATLDLVADRSEHLPDRFKRYLDVTIPKSLVLDIVLAADGSAKLELAVRDDDPPLRVLWPAMLGPMPGFIGVELRSLAFGEVMAGSLFLVEFDGAFDLFDAATLAGALLPLDLLGFLPDTRALQRTIVLDDLFAVIVYQTAIPIPIPLFYDEIAVEYLGIEGVGLQSHLRFPQPSRDLKAIAPLLREMFRFITDRGHLLDAAAPPADLDLCFTLGANYLQTPIYLGDRTLGSRGEIGSISAWENLAHLLNWLKTLRIDELLKSFPLDYRVGRQRASFLGLGVDVAWALTTPQEFATTAYERLALATNDRAGVLAILPRDPNAEDSGVVAFLHGGLELARLVGWQATIGLLASGASGFGTGFRFAGELASVVAVEVAGSVLVDPGAGTPFAIQGACSLRVAEQTVLAGAVAFDGEGLRLSGELRLFSGSNIVAVRAFLVGRFTTDSFLMRGDGALSVAGSPLIAVVAEVSERGMIFAGQWLGVSVELRAVVEGGGLAVAGSFGVTVRVAGTLGPIELLGVRVADGLHLDASVRINFAVGFAASGFTGGIEADVDLPLVPDFHLSATLHVAPTDVEAIAAAVWHEIQRRMEDLFAHMFPDVLQWLAAIQAEIITFIGDVTEAIGRGLAGAYHKNLAEAAAVLRRFGTYCGDVGRALKTGYGVTAEALCAAMKAAGYAALEVGWALGTAYDLGAEVFALLKGAGYTPVEFAQMLRSFMNLTAEQMVEFLGAYYPVTAEVAVTALRTTGYAAYEVGAALDRSFHTTAATAVSLLRGVGYTVGEVGSALLLAYRATPEIAAGVLKGAGHTAREVGAALKSYYAATAALNALALKAAGYTLGEIGGALQSVGVTVEGAAKALHDAGFDALEVAQTLIDTHKLTEWAAVAVLQGAGYGIEAIGGVLSDVFVLGGGREVANLLRSGGYVADEVGSVLRSAFGHDAGATAAALRGANYTNEQIGGAVVKAYGLAADRLAFVMKLELFDGWQVGAALKSAFSLSAEAVASILRTAASYPADKVGQALKLAFNATPTVAANALKVAGYYVTDVGQGLREGLGATRNQVASALRNVGYSVSDAGLALGHLAGSSADSVRTALGAAGYAADEINGWVNSVVDIFDW